MDDCTVISEAGRGGLIKFEVVVIYYTVCRVPNTTHKHTGYLILFCRNRVQWYQRVKSRHIVSIWFFSETLAPKVNKKIASKYILNESNWTGCYTTDYKVNTVIIK